VCITSSCTWQRYNGEPGCWGPEPQPCCDDCYEVCDANRLDVGSEARSPITARSWPIIDFWHRSPAFPRVSLTVPKVASGSLEVIYLPSAAVVHFCLSALDTFEDLQSRYFYALLASCRTGRTELSTVYYSTFVNRKKKFDIDVTSLGILVRFRYTFWPMDHRNQMVFLSFFVLCCSGPIFSQERTVPETYLRLEDLARAARLRGETATSPSRIVSRDYPIVNSLEDALRISTPLLVRVASKAIAVTPHGDRLLTWYKAEIVENLSDASLPDVNIASDIGLAPPQSLGSSDTGSFFIRNQGGVNRGRRNYD